MFEVCNMKYEWQVQWAVVYQTSVHVTREHVTATLRRAWNEARFNIYTRLRAKSVSADHFIDHVKRMLV